MLSLVISVIKSPMLGYRLAGEKLIVVPEEAETVRKIFNYYLLGMGYGKISKTLRYGIIARTPIVTTFGTVITSIINQNDAKHLFSVKMKFIRRLKRRLRALGPMKPRLARNDGAP